MSIIKQFIKASIHSLVPIIGRHRIPFKRHNLLILTYHRVLAENDERIKFEQPGMLVKPETFEQHILTLKQHFEIVKLSDWLNSAAKQSKHLPRLACAITFDDGWQDNYQYAYPILKRHNTPATIFLVSELIGSQDDFWPGKLAKLLHHTALNHMDKWNNTEFDWLKTKRTRYAFGHTPPSNIELDELINHCKSYSDKQNHEYINTATKHLNSARQQTRVLLNETEIKEMLASKLIDIGSHTQNHIRLNSELSQDILEKEVIASKRALEEKFKTTTSLFCYPNGDTCPAAINLVRQHYTGACTTVRGWNHHKSPKHQLKRISIHEDMCHTEKSFLTKINGWL